MNNDLEQFSEERLKQVEASGLWSRLSHAESQALARIALSVKQAKPVAWFVGDATLYNSDTIKAYAKRSGFPVIRLYTTPQPAHTEHVIPSEIPKVPHNGVMAYKKDGSIYSTNYARGWNDCVQAMLAAAPKPESE